MTVGDDELKALVKEGEAAAAELGVSGYAYQTLTCDGPIEIASPDADIAFDLGNEVIPIRDMLAEVRACRADIAEWKALREAAMATVSTDGIPVCDGRGLPHLHGSCADVESLTGMSTRTIGQQLRKTCLHDNGDGTFALTLLVDVRAADIGEATEILAAGRRLQDRFDA